MRSASHTDQSSGVVADERRREDSQPGGEWEVRRAHEASGRSREGAQLANRNSLDGRDGNNRFVVARSRDRFDELHRLNAQCVRQFDDVDQTDVTFASFDSADIVSMQVRQLRQAFLGKAALRPQFANASAE